MAGPFMGAIGSSMVAFTVHVLLLPKSLMPQLTIVSVIGTTWLSAAVTWFHLDSVPQFILHEASAFQSIDPDLSSRIRMSGGCGIAPWFTAAQFESGVDMLFASTLMPASIVGTTG